jgi:hypothetical protein
MNKVDRQDIITTTTIIIPGSIPPIDISPKTLKEVVEVDVHKPIDIKIEDRYIDRQIDMIDG